MIVIFRYKNPDTFENKMKSLGCAKRDPKHFKAPERSYLAMMGQPIIDIHSDTFQRGNISDEDANKFLSNDHSPSFSIVWRDDDLDAEGNLKPEPMAEVYTYDFETNDITGTRFQQSGTF